MDIDLTLRDLALLSSRLTLGATMAGHGAQKLFGIQNGPGLKGTAKMMSSLGFNPAERYGAMLAAGELSSGALIALGALGPVGPAILTSIMLVAIETVHRPKGYWNQNGGYEMNAMFVANAVMLANEGYGRISLDHVFGLREKLRPMHAWIALGCAVAGSLYLLAQRAPQQPNVSDEVPSAAPERERQPA